MTQLSTSGWEFYSGTILCTSADNSVVKLKRKMQLTSSGPGLMAFERILHTL